MMDVAPQRRSGARRPLRLVVSPSARRAAWLTLLLATGTGAQADEAWPTRAIRIIVPFSAGGVTDTIARLSAEWLRAKLGQPTIVENRPGANGVIAVEAVAKAEPDGYTLLTASASQMVMLPALKSLKVDPAADLQPISIVASNPMVLAVSPKLGVRTLPEFLALARDRKGTLNYSTAGVGSSTHLAMALLLARAGVDMQAVPYRGGAPAMQALLSGDVAAYFGNPSDIIPHADTPNIRVLAIAGLERLPSLPGVPTVAEQGFPGFRTETWNGIAAPVGTPDPIVRRIAETLAEACRDPAFRSSLDKAGTTPVCGTPEAFRDAMAADAPMWREAVRISGAHLD